MDKSLSRRTGNGHKHVTDAMRLSPLDPMSFRPIGAVALAHFVAGRYDEASLGAEKALRERANFLPAIRDLAASRALAGRDSEAQAAVAKRVGHPPTPAPDLLASGGCEIFEAQKSFKGVSKIFSSQSYG
jgi:hypothetical protein